MKPLQEVKPTSEQLPLITNARPGVKLIRGAAGSGKTTTALLMLRHLSSFWARRKQRMGIPGSVNVLVITFNRTLRGYIYDLANNQVDKSVEVNLTVSTFGKFARGIVPEPEIVEERERINVLSRLSRNVPWPSDFVIDEVEYIIGRFPKTHLEDYLMCNRIGRGPTPRIERGKQRKMLLEEVVYPYNEWKQEAEKMDWNDLALEIYDNPPPTRYNILVVDEAQDLSANEIRALMKVAAEPSSVVFIIDTAQRIYPRGCTWSEAGVEKIVDSHRLKENHRNTVEICKFALPLLDGIELGDDGTFPDLHSCKHNGPIPIIIKGLYRGQLNYVINHIKSNIDLQYESVAFLHARGGGWFNTLKAALKANSLEYVEITKLAEWPVGSENIALSTLYSAKGLEFDHVFILGLNEEVTSHGEEEEDTSLQNWRRMLAMGITRAREHVIVGYKPEQASILISFLDPDTYDEVSV